MIQNILGFTWKHKSWGGNHESRIIIVFQKQLEGGNNPLITMTSILQLQLEGGYNAQFIGYNLKEASTP